MKTKARPILYMSQVKPDMFTKIIIVIYKFVNAPSSKTVSIFALYYYISTVLYTMNPELTVVFLVCISFET